MSSDSSLYNRRAFLKSACIGLGIMALPSCCYTVQKSTKRPPNIILILADDLGYKELGCYGQEKIKTPHVDRMAAEGMRLMQFYAGSPVCAPSRGCLLTGKYTGHAYIRTNVRHPQADLFGGQLPLPENEITIAKVLKGCGYVTGCFGKWSLGNTGTSGAPQSQGFDRFYGYECQSQAHHYYPSYLVSDGNKVELEGNNNGVMGKQYAPQLIHDETLKFIRQHKDKPFFVYDATPLPHLALQIPEEELEQYKGKWPETPYTTGEGYLPHPTPKACYAAMVSYLDKQVGHLLSVLKELGIDDNTLVIFTSDNGTTYLKEQVDYEFFDSVGPLRGLKGSLYEGGIRVPLIARWPGKITPNTVSNHIAANYDLPATFVEAAGCKAVLPNDGISFLPQLLGQTAKQKKHDYLFWEFCDYGGQLAVRMGKWKGVKQNLLEDPSAKLELYDLENDISEKNNVADQHPAIVAKIEKNMIDARTQPQVKEFRFGSYSN